MLSRLNARTAFQQCHSISQRTLCLTRQAAASQLAVGIDLGTTQSVVSYLEGGQATVIADDKGRTTTPSVVAHQLNAVSLAAPCLDYLHHVTCNHLQDDLVGHAAVQQAIVNPRGTFAATKRLMGRMYTDSIVGQVGVIAQSRWL
jgi:molecular chaperone DnaK